MADKCIFESKCPPIQYEAKKYFQLSKRRPKICNTISILKISMPLPQKRIDRLGRSMRGSAPVSGI